LTGYGQKEDRRAAEQAGFDQHLVKPADPEALLACIEAWTAERSREHALHPRAHGDA
jgi:CheY-like chemotaxis protein